MFVWDVASDDCDAVCFLVEPEAGGWRYEVPELLRHFRYKQKCLLDYFN